MQYNFNQPIYQLNGKPYQESVIVLDNAGNPAKDQNGNQKYDVVDQCFSKFVADAILENRKPVGVEKITYFNLAEKIHNTKENVDLSPQEIAIVKDSIELLTTKIAVPIMKYMQSVCE